MSNNVDHPPHYTAHPSGVECIQITEHMGFSLGNAVKYIWRADLKGDAVEDLRKARWYIDRELQRIAPGEPWRVPLSDDEERKVSAVRRDCPEGYVVVKLPSWAPAEARWWRECGAVAEEELIEATARALEARGVK
ncbi:hypothetical protein CGZ93_17805 [Enemella dayhoffiae]|uniref:DUF3310 domain-containing protein n=1 Tax=Enemella dayhoffiae TaxID=2016507 RepID=A0A255GLB2_9ACTN|nr:DUF3310 domain-containing protein [Enemella dayhoffiae]OYO16615.1 hypothetical protein CGZ93_17805 [Enemella dayhoffiae]